MKRTFVWVIAASALISARATAQEFVAHEQLPTIDAQAEADLATGLAATAEWFVAGAPGYSYLNKPFAGALAPYKWDAAMATWVPQPLIEASDSARNAMVSPSRQ